ncbi:MAG: polynucleotide adenylyltransferase [Clostridia bacterium]|nr:polynucleotide adenylyltransferase [Clostridia bacterium]
MTLHYPENVVKIAEILAKNGYKAYAVGGCMRDTLMGRVPNDWDMTTDCSPEKMLEIFDREGVRTIPTGLKHGTVSVLLDGEIYECTTFRIDGSYTDSRHPDKVTFTQDITEDLRRRDFTVNAMAGDPLSGSLEIVDVFGGREDIENRIIRAVGDPEKRFTEDALRILRAIRFATVLDFEIDGETKAAAVKLGGRLADISAERKSVELQKILLSDYADRGIALLLETDLAKYIHPDIKSPKVTLSGLPKRFSTRLAALFAAVPNLSCMKLSGELVKQTKALCDDVFYRETVAKLSEADACARLMLSKYGEIAEDAALLRNHRESAQRIAEERAKNPCVILRDLAVGGNDLLAAGIEPKKLGSIMSSLLLSVIENPSLNQKETLVKMAIKLAQDERI